MTTFLKLNGTDWTGMFSDVTLEPRNTKQVKTNVKGGAITLPSRVAASSFKIQFVFPFLEAPQMLSLQALYDAQDPIAVEHGFEFAEGDYIPVDFAKSRVAKLAEVIYHVVLTLARDIAPNVPLPVDDGSLTVGNITKKLGV